MLPCPLYQFTGLQCPFCGVQRGVLALCHGDIAAWWNFNPVAWCMVPYLLLLVVGEVHPAWRQSRLVRFCYSNRAIFTAMGILLIWGIVRNI